MDSLKKLHELERKVHQLVSIVEQLTHENKKLKEKVQLLQKRKKDENMTSVKREIIRTKVQSMLNMLEDV